jgi:hypothetical protein
LRLLLAEAIEGRSTTLAGPGSPYAHPNLS